MKKLRALFERYYDVITYLFFGGLTTVVNYIVFFCCRHIWDVSLEFSDVIAWIAAVAFAYVTNKPFVFKSNDWSAKILMQELPSFVGCRIGSLMIEIALHSLTVRVLQWNEVVMKILISIFVVIINYFGSKFLVFAKKK